MAKIGFDDECIRDAWLHKEAEIDMIDMVQTPAGRALLVALAQARAEECRSNPQDNDAPFKDVD